MEVFNALSKKQLIRQSQLDQELERESKMHKKIIRLIREKKYPLHISNVLCCLKRDPLWFSPESKISIAKYHWTRMLD